MIVVDTNIVAALTLGGPGTDPARLLFAKYPDWRAPTLWRSEFRSVLTGYMRRRMLTLDAAMAVQQQAHSAVTDSTDADPDTILELVSASRCSAYDCEFVALALELEVPLVTRDRQVIHAFPRIAVPFLD